MLSYSHQLQIRARAEIELRKRGGREASPFAQYQLDPHGYICTNLGWQPWQGDGEHPGQVEVLNAYTAALRAQLEHPGESTKNTIRIEAGHTVGKTKLLAGLVSHFFDCFPPAIVYCFAPGHDQINDLLFKELRTDRAPGRGLPGRVLETPEIKLAGNHFVKGRATSNAHGRGTERVQGQHGKHLMFILDEAEGIDGYVFDAVRSMSSGGLSIIVLAANPRTRTSRFHRLAEMESAVSFRISCLYHPNVLTGREVVPGAVQRRYVEEMIDNGTEQHAEVVETHDQDVYTFELPWRPGVIYRPDSEFMFRVLGIAPANIADDVFVPNGRYEAAKKRRPVESEPQIARLGIDVARFGTDMGTLYTRWNGRIYRAAQFAQQDSNAYLRAIRTEARRLRTAGVTDIAFRVDGGGGFGSGVIDGLKSDLELRRLFASYQVYEVHFNATPRDPSRYADLATEIYGHTAEALRTLALVNPPNMLETDLCDRKFGWVVSSQQHIQKDVKEIESKKIFRRRLHRSPDDGDGCALAVAPDQVFARQKSQPAPQSVSMRTL